MHLLDQAGTRFFCAALKPLAWTHRSQRQFYLFIKMPIVCPSTLC